MASITITVQSLLNTAVYDSYTIDNGQTVNQLKTAINTARSFDSTWYDIVQNGSVVAGTTTLSALGITTGTVLRTHNKINDLSTRELRQKAKLDLAQLKRQAGGNITAIAYRENNVYDITELPTQYISDTSYNNPNPSGLLLGRPWVNVASITFAPDIYYYNRVGTTTANGYFADDVAFFDTPVVSPVTQTTGTTPTINISNQPQYNSIQYIGYFKAPATATFTLYTSSDDASYLWIGPTAVSGYSTTNALVQNGGLHGTVERSATINLVQNIYYPIRIQFGNNTGPGVLTVSYSTPSISKTSDWTGLIFHNSATNGF
jgi:hypothetical protein